MRAGRPPPQKKMHRHSENVTKRSSAREQQRKKKQEWQAHTTSPQSPNVNSKTPTSSSQLASVTREKRSSGRSQLTPPTEALPSTTKWPTRLSSAIQTALSSPQTWTRSLNPNPPRNTRNATSATTNLQPLPSTTGRTRSTPKKTPSPKPSESGKLHATNSPQTPSFPKAGSFQPSTPSIPTNAPPESKVSTPPPLIFTPINHYPTGKDKKRKPTKCTPPGKPSITVLPQKSTSPSPSACGTTDTTTSTYESSPTPGNPFSRTAPSANGEELTNTPAEEASPERRKSLPNPTSLYYDGDTQQFSISTPVTPVIASTPTPTTTTSEPTFSPPFTQTNNNNKNIKKSKRKTKRKKKENKENGNNNEQNEQNHNNEINNVNNNTLKAIDKIAGDDAYPPSPAPSVSPRVNECSANKITLRVYTHNVNGLRDETKLEFIPRIMKKKNIDAYLIQETHLAGNFEKVLIDDYYIIHHGPESQPTNGKRGGVAIILSPNLHLQWRTSGKAKKILRGGPSIGETTRFLSISMRFEMPKTNNNINKKKKIPTPTSKNITTYA